MSSIARLFLMKTLKVKDSPRPRKLRIRRLVEEAKGVGESKGHAWVLVTQVTEIKSRNTDKLIWEK